MKNETKKMKMADFKTAYDLVIINEGGYGNDPDDPGGETYKGVARKMWPLWLGWHIIDLMRSQSGFPASLEKNAELQEEVESFYEMQFWNKVSGSLIAEQAVANSIFDFAVNAGVVPSVTLAQKVVDAPVDGAIGPQTIGKINAFDSGHFLAAFAVEKIRRYIDIVRKRPASAKYFLGWISRAVNQ
jgi:lysozyme family protein